MSPGTKTALKNLILTAVCLVAITVLISKALPSSWEISREVQVHATTIRCREAVGDLKSWEDWSPWGYSVDPKVTMQTGLMSQGEGATLDWSGPKAGAGMLKVLSESRDQGLAFDLTLREGRERLTGRIECQDLTGSSTKVIWTLRGDVGSDVIGRYVCVWRGYTMGPDMVDALRRLKKKIELRY